MSRIQADTAIQQFLRLLGTGVGRTLPGQGKVEGLKPQPLPYELPPVVADAPRQDRATAVDSFLAARSQQTLALQTYTRLGLVDAPARADQPPMPTDKHEVGASLQESIAPNPSLPSPCRYASE